MTRASYAELSTAALLAAYNGHVETCEHSGDETRFNAAYAALMRIGAELERRGIVYYVNAHGYASVAA